MIVFSKIGFNEKARTNFIVRALFIGFHILDY